MRKFSIRIFLFIVFPLPILFGLNYIVDTGLRKSHNFFYAEWNDLMQGKINADLLICGSSRAWVHVSPKILDSVLHTNSYNLGMDGTQFSMQYGRFKIYLQHNKPPKYIVHTVDFTTFYENKGLHAREQFLPYLYDTSIRALTEGYEGRFVVGEYYFPLYKYNNQFPLIKEGVKSFFNKGEPVNKYKGYQGQNKSWDFTFDNLIKKSPNGNSIGIDSNSVRLMDEYIDYCKKNNIKVILVFAPVYYEFMKYCTNKDEIIGVYKSLSAKYNIPFLSYLEDDLSMHKANFYNSQHLNRNGAEIFSLKLANDLVPLLEKNKPTYDKHL